MPPSLSRRGIMAGLTTPAAASSRICWSAPARWRRARPGRDRSHRDSRLPGLTAGPVKPDPHKMGCRSDTGARNGKRRGCGPAKVHRKEDHP